MKPTLKTIHNTDTGEPTRVRYKSDVTTVGFDVETVADDENGVTRVAVLDSMSAEPHSGDEKAWIDIEDIAGVFEVVSGLTFIDGVDAFGERIK